VTSRVLLLLLPMWDSLNFAKLSRPSLVFITLKN
jgi:hypothetical protein